MKNNLLGSICLAAVAAACGGTQGSTTPPPPTDFTVTGSSAVVVASGATVQLIATANGGVTWSLHPGDPGAITADGVYTAPAGAAEVTAIASAVRDSSKTASVVIAAIPPDLTGPAKVTAGSAFVASVPLPIPEGITCTWSAVTATVIDGQSTGSVHVQAGDATVSNLNLFATLADGNHHSVTAAVRPQIVPHAPLPVFSTVPSLVHPRAQVGVLVTNLEAGMTATWSITNGAILDGQGTPGVTFTAGASGETVLTVQIDNGLGDLNRASVRFTILLPPETPVITTQPFVLSGVPGASAVADRPVTWTVTGDATVTSDPGDAFLTYTPGASGQIEIVATARDVLGDSAAAQVTVTVASSGLQLFAGIPGGLGFLDGPGSSARLLSPAGLTVDPLTGDLLLADFTTVRRYGAGMLTTIAGTPDQSGACQGQGSSALLPLLSGIAVDETGIVYASGTDGNICRIDLQANVTLFATLPSAIAGLTYAGGILTAIISGGVATQYDLQGNVAGTVDGQELNGFFSGREPILVAGPGLSGNLLGAGLIGAPGQQQAALVDLTTGVTLAGQPSGGLNACVAGALLCDPTALALEQGIGNVLIADSGTKTIARWNGVTVTLAAGTVGVAGSADGPASQATFGSFSGMTSNAASDVFILDADQGLLRKIEESTVSTIAGVKHLDGAASGAAVGVGIPSPVAVAVGADGSVFVAEFSGVVLRISPKGVAAPMATVPRPTHLAAGANGTVLVSCADSIIRSIDADGTVTVFAGNGTAGFANGPAATAMFGAFRISSGQVTDGRFPSAGGALAWDGVDTLYVADPDNRKIRAVRNGQVSTYVDNLNGPEGVAMSGGKLYVFAGRNTVYRFAPGASLETIDGLGGFITFGGLAVDAVGNAYLEAPERSSVLELAPGASSTSNAVGSTKTLALVSGALPASLGSPVSLAFAPAGAPNAGMLFIADFADNAVAMVRP